MDLVLCVDLDDDLGRKTGVETPVVGREAVERAAVELATADPEDSDVNVLFEGVHVYDRMDPDTTEVVAVTGNAREDVTASRELGGELDAVLTGVVGDGPARAVVVTDGAQDESVLPVIRSRVTVDAVRRVVVRQAEDLESLYYTMKQVLDDPETRGTILVPLGILLLIYPLSVLANYLNLPGTVLGLTSALLGLYALSRGLGIEETVEEGVEDARNALYAGRVTIITYVVAAALIVVGLFSGVGELRAVEAAATEQQPVGAIEALSAFLFGSVRWLAAGGITSSIGQITDEYLDGQFRWRFLNAPFYVLAIAAVLHAVSAFFLQEVTLSYLAASLTGGTLLGLASTLAFAIAEDHFAPPAEPAG